MTVWKVLFESVETRRGATETVLSVLNENFQLKIENLNFFKMCHNFAYSSNVGSRTSGRWNPRFVIIIISNHDRSGTADRIGIVELISNKLYL